MLASAGAYSPSNSTQSIMSFFKKLFSGKTRQEETTANKFSQDEHEKDYALKEQGLESVKRRFCGSFTTIGNYSSQAVLNPRDTCEVPGDEDDDRCILFDDYSPVKKGFKIGDRQHHLLLCMEVFRSEMEYARANGSNKLIELLQQKGYYPYSDLDREPVV